MAADPLSRYAGLTALRVPGPGGRATVALPARLAPVPPANAIARRHLVVAGDTLESLAAAYYGSSDAWWRIADANPRASPFGTAPGTMLVIPEGTRAGRVRLRRVF
jgi:nucleoid-associated protein YgaU